MAQAQPQNLKLLPLCGDFGVEALGVDISQAIDEATIRTLRAGFDRHGLLVLNKNLTMIAMQRQCSDEHYN